MTVSTTTNRVSYTGAGTTGPFSFPYYFLEDSDLKVVKVTIATGAQTTLTLTTHYTVAGAGEAAGGSVTLVSSLSSAFKLVIIRDPDTLQNASYPRNDPFPAATHQRVADKLAMLVQRLKDRVDRCFGLSDGDVTGGTTQLIAVANKAVIFDASGNLTTSTDDYEDQAVATAADAAAAAASAAAASTSETNADTSEALAQDWATKTSGIVASTDYSAKEFARGTQASTGGSAKNWAQQTGADVTGAAANSRSAKSWSQDVNTGATLGGSSKDWAQTTGGTVDGTNYSSKEHAVGTTTTTGSSKDWATKTSAAVTAGVYSAKEWATGTQTRGAASGGSAKDWASYTSGTVDNSEYSAKKYAQDSSASASAASTSETNASSSAAAATAAVEASATIKYLFDSSTSMADPGTGDLRLNNATIASVTAIAVSASAASTGNPDLSDYIATWDDSTNTNKGTLVIREAGANTFAVFTVTGVADNSTWLQLAVTHVASGGSLSAADVLFVGFSRAGDLGATGPAGSVTDGDKGDITVSSSGAAWTIDNDVVTGTKLNDSVVNDLTTVTAASGDYVAIADVSDSNKKKKALISDIVAMVSAGGFTAAAPQATTSGTAFDFTGIPSTAKVIVVHGSGVSSTNGGADFTVRLGDSGGIETSGYAVTTSGLKHATAVSVGAYGNGFALNQQISGSAANLYTFTLILTLVDSATNTWSGIGICQGGSGSQEISCISGSKATSATLDRVRFTTVSGYDYDGGSVSVMYST